MERSAIRENLGRGTQRPRISLRSIRTTDYGPGGSVL